MSESMAGEGYYYCETCQKETKFIFQCWQSRTTRQALDFEQTPSQSVLCCTKCRSPL